MASGMAFDASRLYARNLSNLLLLMTNDGTVTLNLDDEIVAGALVVHDGAVRA
jgi:NAD(P) transhydrogenase subunit alpha